MAIYLYEGREIDGKISKGKIEAESKIEVKNKLREKGVYATSIKPQVLELNINFRKENRVTDKDLSILCRQMYFTLSAGIPLLRSVEMIKSQIENKRIREILEHVYDEIQKGASLSRVFKQHKEIPYMLTGMIEVGEATGGLDTILGDMAEYYDKQYRLKKKIDAALTYPKFLLAFALLVVFILVTFVVPSFVEGILSAGQDLPLPTKIVINTSYFLRENLLLVILIIVGLYAFKKLYIDKNEAIQYKIDKFLIKDKRIASISRQIFTARFARTFSLLMAGGMNIMDALDISGNAVNNRFIKENLFECKSMISIGRTISGSIESKNVFPEMLTQMMRVGEESGNLDAILKNTSDYYDVEAEFALQKLTSLIEPILIVFLAILVGFVVISIAMPMFQVMGAV